MTAGDRNRAAWNVASRKYVDESADLLAEATTTSSLLPSERAVLTDILTAAPRVVHLQSGNGQDALDLRRSGAASVVGVDFSEVTTAAAAGRARQLSIDVQHVVGDALAVPLRTACADLVYTGKGALVWLPSLTSWAAEVSRLLDRGGHLFLHDEHPAAAMWTWDEAEPRRRADRSYFGGTRANDTFPQSAIARFGDDPNLHATEWQWTIADLVNAVVGADMTILRLDEHAEPFWRPAGEKAAAWDGMLPNSLTLLARRP